MTTLSLIIPAYNDLPGVMAALTSLRATVGNGQQIQGVLVQDDCSPALDMRPCIPPDLGWVERNERNLGFGGNCNAAAKRAPGDILVFINQDITAAPQSAGWDMGLAAAFDNLQVGIVGARLLFPNGSIQSAGGLLDSTGMPFHRCISYANPLYEEVNQPRAVDWVTGAFMAVRRPLFETLGGFDEMYVGGYFEDADLCLRARELGALVWYQPSCTLIHNPGSSGGNPRHFADNARKFRERWVESGRAPKHAYWVSPVRLW